VLRLVFLAGSSNSPSAADILSKLEGDFICEDDSSPVLSRNCTGPEKPHFLGLGADVWGGAHHSLVKAMSIGNLADGRCTDVVSVGKVCPWLTWLLPDVPYDVHLIPRRQLVGPARLVTCICGPMLTPALEDIVDSGRSDAVLLADLNHTWGILRVSRILIA
jgi:hypothetical protein